MPSDYWENFAGESGFEWDEVERIHVSRDDTGEWEIYFELDDGEMTFLDDALEDDQMESLFWDDLYFYAQENDIYIDKDIEYAED